MSGECCSIDTLSPCTIDEAIKNALVTGGVTSTIRTGGLAHQDSGVSYPIMVLELLNPTNPRPVCGCVQHEAVLQIRIFGTTKIQGVTLANQATTLLKGVTLESQSGNFRMWRATPPVQLELPDGLFLTRVNMSLSIWTPQ